MLKNIVRIPSIISCKRGRSLKDIPVRAKLWETNVITSFFYHVRESVLSCLIIVILCIFKNILGTFTASFQIAKKIKKFSLGSKIMLSYKYKKEYLSHSFLSASSVCVKNISISRTFCSEVTCLHEFFVSCNLNLATISLR